MKWKMEGLRFFSISSRLYLIVLISFLLPRLIRATDPEWNPRSRNMLYKCISMADKVIKDFYCQVFIECCDIALTGAQCIRQKVSCDMQVFPIDRSCEGHNCTELPPTTPAPMGRLSNSASSHSFSCLGK